MKKTSIFSLVMMVYLLCLPCCFVQAESVCKHPDKKFIRYIEGGVSGCDYEEYEDYESDMDEIDYLNKYVTLSRSEEIEEFNNKVIVIYDKAKDCRRYVYGHEKLYYCPTCNEQVYQFELCRFTKWKLGEQDNYTSDQYSTISTAAGHEFVYECECGRYKESYPYLKAGKYFFTEMPKSYLNVGQIGLNKWVKVSNWQPPNSLRGKGTYMVMAVKQSDGELEFLCETAKDNTYITIPYKKTKSYIFATYRQSPVKTIKVTKGKKIVSVKKSGSYKVKIKGRRRGKAKIKIVKKSGAVVFATVKVR